MGLDLPPALECVPNVAEGRRPELVARFRDALAGTPGARVLDVSSDPDHDRTVFTLVGDVLGLVAALESLYEVVLATIDLNRPHGGRPGVHPRIGAVDVVPFVPLGDTPLAEAVAAAEELGRRVAERFDLPVFLYEKAARAPERVLLAEVRRGGFEGLPARLADPRWRPDFGPARRHPTAGATVIGARDFLIAWNVLLDTADVGVARAIAATLRESAPGGLPGVRALGVYLESRGRAQVTMNLVDFRRTTPWGALEAVRREALRLGVGILGSELVGLVPEEALWASLSESLALPGLDASRVLEQRWTED